MRVSLGSNQSVSVFCTAKAVQNVHYYLQFRRLCTRMRGLEHLVGINYNQVNKEDRGLNQNGAGEPVMGRGRAMAC